MSLYSKEVDYSIFDSGFYGEPEITYGKKGEGDPTTSASSASGAWDDYQHEREHISSCVNNGNSHQH